MVLNPNSLFPNLRFKEINLNDWLKNNSPKFPKEANLQQALLHQLHGSLQAVSYGGWFEDRSWMWAGTYMDQTGTHTHLGVDINVPAGTTIVLPFDVTILNSYQDKDCDVGWGSRLCLQKNSTSPVLVLGHLEENVYKVGTQIKAGSEIAKVGTYPANGNVFEHLHLQLIAADQVPTMNWETLDGYGKPSDQAIYPNPFTTEL